MLSGEVESLPARHQQHQFRACAVQLRHELGRLEHVLAVVDREQQSPAGQVTAQRLARALARHLCDGKRACDRRSNIVRAAHASELDPAHPVTKRRAERAYYLERETRLADTPRARERHQPRIGTCKEPAHRCELFLSPDQRDLRPR